MSRRSWVQSASTSNNKQKLIKAKIKKQFGTHEQKEEINEKSICRNH
jgi:hypothetical protein